ncbi:MAG: hypothetical protein P1V20_17210, partial [Verrucomicrobiales bacterium]|nr:hypothetical protein [Verrucomicrobiales bacterium]
ADTVAKVEATEKLEGAAMKTPDKPVVEEKVEEVVAVADKMKEEPKPTISKKLAPIKKTPPKPEDTPLVIATKRPDPTKTEEGDPAAPGEAPTVAAADTAATDSRPEATARSVTPLKDLGRMLFGPKEGGTRGPIFKRKKAAAANPQ